jgi:Flp pilus assembly protein TadD
MSIYMIVNYTGAAQVRTAGDLGRAGLYAAAITEAKKVSAAPAKRDALLIIAYAYVRLGRLAQARHYFQLAEQRDPNNWTIHNDLAQILLRFGDQTGFQREMARTLQLNPRISSTPFDLAGFGA